MAMDSGLGYWLTRRAAITPTRTALVFEGESWDYAEFNRRANRLAHALRALGVSHGDRVAYLDLNHPDFFLTLFAAAKLGAIFVPLNFRLTPPELAFIIADAGVHTLVHDEAFAAVVMRSFDPGGGLDLIPRHRVSTMFGVPAMFLFVSQHPGFAAADLSSVRFLLCGGAPVPEALIRLYGARGLTFAHGYGLTETAPFVTLVPIDRALDKIGSAGLPPFFTDVRLVDDDGREVAIGERGEVVVRGPNVMKGYWNRPEATAEAIRNGWFHTGDIGTRDAEGFFYIVDRKKDMIISGGENVYPAEVEDCLYQHPGIAEAAVIGLPDSRWGEVVLAIVVIKPGTSVTE